MGDCDMIFALKACGKEKTMSKNATDVVAYITWIGWIVAFCAGTRQESNFHINQALILWIIVSALGVLGVIPIVNIVSGILTAVWVVFWIMGLVSAFQGEEKELPFIGAIKLIK